MTQDNSYRTDARDGEHVFLGIVIGFILCSIILIATGKVLVLHDKEAIRRGYATFDSNGDFQWCTEDK